MQIRPSQEQESAPRAQHLRYRRVGGGYRPDDVEQTLTGLRRTVRRLDAEVEGLRARAAVLEADLAVARADLEDYRSQPATEQVLEEALEQAAEIEEAARRRARVIVAEAEAPAAGEPARAVGELQIFETRIDVDAGPMADADEVSAFERALARLSCTDDVYVRSLADGRAAIELLLVQPVRLVPLLREGLPYDLDVREATSTSLVLDLRAA